MFRDPAPEPDRIGHEQVVADELDACAELPGEQLPAVPIVFGESVFDRNNRITIDQVAVEATISSAERARWSERAKTYLPFS